MNLSLSASEPDSGWSWIVAASCCFLNMVIFGISRLNGLFLVETRRVFLVSREKAALPYTLSLTFRNFMSPVVGVVADKFGIRQTTFLGLLGAGISMAVCFVAKDVTWIVVFFGLFYGIGYGFGNALLPLSINQYFDKYRATASGISHCGADIGNFVFAPLLTAIIAEYGLKGTFLFISAFIFQCLPLALLLKTPTYIINQEKFQNRKTLEQTIEQKIYLSDANEISNTNVINNHRKNNEGRETCFERHTTVAQEQEGDSTHCSKNHTDCQIATVKPNSTMLIKQIDSNPVDVQSNDNSIIKKCFRLCKSPSYILVLFSTGAYGYIFICLLMSIVDYMKDIGIEDKNVQYILMIFSISDLIGRIILGLIPDLGYMSKSSFTAFLYVMQGLLLAACAWTTSFTSISLVLAFYGIFQSGILPMTPVLMAHYVEHDLQAIAVPSSNFLIAPVSLFVPPVIGLFREKWGSYQWIFYHLGIMSGLIAVLWFCVALDERRKNKR